MEVWNVVLPDIPRFYTALAEWLACFICVVWSEKRFGKVQFALVSAAALGIQSAFLVLTEEIEGAGWMLCMAAAVGLMYAYIRICTKMNWKDCAYYCVGAFVIAEFAASLEWQIYCFTMYTLGKEIPWIRIGWLVLIYGLVYGVMFAAYKNYRRGEAELLVTDRELASYSIIGLSVFLMSNLGFVSIRTPFSGQYMPEIFNVRTIVDLGGLAILYAYHVQKMELKVRHELESVQNMLYNQYAQYQKAQEAVDIINYKHHDLKHHILALRAEENTQKRNQYLDKMEAEIRTYEAQNKTGNPVLDTLLTAKGLYCAQNDITLTCVVDGTLFSFLDVMDICSIFGNALDNAIEYEQKIEDTRKRLIHVSAFSQHNFLIVRFENYCEDTPDFYGELPVTTKEDPRFHGYGLKSLRYTVRKYGGEVDIQIQDNWFNLKILIPMKMEEKE